MEQIVEEFLNAENQNEKTKIYLEKIHNKSLHKEFHAGIKKVLALKDHINKRYYYLITFTLKNYDKIEIMDEMIEKYITSRLRRPALQIEKAHLVKEYTTNKKTR